MLNWLLVFVPTAVALEYFAPQQHLLVFLAAGLGIVALAGWIGRATEQLVEHLGEGPGGLLNATFANATELIIALAALRAGLHDVVKASVVGAIIGNMLLVLGAAMLAGGLRHREQHFSRDGARAQATMLTLAAITLILPAAFKAAFGGNPAKDLIPVSVSISIIILIVYGLFLVFSLITHSALFSGSDAGGEAAQAGAPHWSMRKALLVLGVVAAAIAFMSEILVGAIEPTAHEFGLSNIFVGVFVIAVLGNAAENFTAITAAMRGRMDLSLAIAIGSSIQVALFVAPVLVLASLFLGPQPMDMVFPAGLVLSVLLAVLITGQVAGDGRSDWLKGVQLLTVYLVLGLTFFFIPDLAAR